MQRLKGILSMALGASRALLQGLLLVGLMGTAWTPFALAESPGRAALLLQSVNKTRVESGAAPLERNATLDIAAAAQAAHLARLGQLSHLGPNQERLGARLHAVGYDYAESAENLASGPAKASRVSVLWQESPGHKLNMLHPTYSEAGIGIAVSPEGGDYWVLIVARPRAP